MDDSTTIFAIIKLAVIGASLLAQPAGKHYSAGKAVSIFYGRYGNTRLFLAEFFVSSQRLVVYKPGGRLSGLAQFSNVGLQLALLLQQV